MRQRQQAGVKGRHATSAHTAQVVAAEAAALGLLSSSLPGNHRELLSFLLAVTGKIIFSGMGKSGHVARLLAATFSSVGLPALFLHPGEAVHGDMGVLQQGDVCVLLSKSGNTEELIQFAQAVRMHQIPCVLLTCDAGDLVQLASLTVRLPFEHEACDYNMVPTSSILVILAYGHGVALELATQKGLNPASFGRVHPAGSLGKNLLLTVEQCMIAGSALPLVTKSDSFTTILSIITRGCKGVALVVDAQKKLHGLITDGDLRRAAEQGPAVFGQYAYDIMTVQPQTIATTVKAQDALEIMYKKRITSLAVLRDDATVQGLVHVHDIIAAGVTPRTAAKEEKL